MKVSGVTVNNALLLHLLATRSRRRRGSHPTTGMIMLQGLRNQDDIVIRWLTEIIKLQLTEVQAMLAAIQGGIIPKRGPLKTLSWLLFMSTGSLIAGGWTTWLFSRLLVFLSFFILWILSIQALQMKHYQMMLYKRRKYKVLFFQWFRWLIS